MNKEALILLVSVIIVLGLGSLFSIHEVEYGTGPSFNVTPSMKGYEVYAWQGDSQWYFSLLPGTNRIKAYGEVTGATTRLEGQEALETELARLTSGDYVTFKQYEFVDGKPDYPELTLPPRRTMGEIFQVCAERNLNCIV